VSNLVITQSNIPWFVKLSFPYNVELKNYVKQLPGPFIRDKWDPLGKTWTIASECVSLVEGCAKRLGYSVLDRRVQPTFGIEAPGLHEYQRLAASSGVGHRRWIFADEMGLGKSAEFITAARLQAPSRVLVVGPAIVRRNWVKEFKKWWPENQMEIGIIDAGLSRRSLGKSAREKLERATNAPFQICSYNLLHKLTQKTGWEVIGFDECHRLKNPRAKWATCARELVKGHPDASVYGLTATPMPDRPLDVCGIMECMCPGRFGGLTKLGELPFGLKQRYANALHNGYGWSFSGLNPLYADELATRIRGFSSRTTKLEVAHLLPPFDVHYLEIEPESPRDFRAIQDDLGTNFRSHTEKVDYALMRSGQEKIEAAVEWATDALESNTHIAICTHLKETARAIAKRCEEKFVGTRVLCITGEIEPGKRNELLDEAKADARCVVVATMHSVGIGIDLTFCPVACLAELYYRPETVIQLLGRFSRLSGTVPSSVTILVVKGSIDEAIAYTLQAKIEALNKAMTGGLSETQLVEKLAGTEVDFLTQVEQACASMLDNPYE
jgi:SNF2 family DNA or RNA helicase